MSTIITCPLCRETYTETELEQKVKGPDGTSVECPVCLDNKNNYYKFNKCKHPLCTDCYEIMVAHARERRDELLLPPGERQQFQQQFQQLQEQLQQQQFQQLQQQQPLVVPQLSAPPPPQPSVPPHDREGEFVQHPVTGIPMFRRYVWDPVTGDRMLEPFSGGKKRKTKKRKGRNNRKKTRRKKQSRTVRRKQSRTVRKRKTRRR